MGPPKFSRPAQRGIQHGQQDFGHPNELTEVLPCLVSGGHAPLSNVSAFCCAAACYTSA
jgi:hypothetical protein